MQSAHGGNLRQLSADSGLAQDQILDFSANINPQGPPENVRAAIVANLAQIVHYPDPDCTRLVSAITREFGLPAERIIAGNGSTEILRLLPRVLQKQRAILPVPAYLDYAAACQLAELQIVRLELLEAEDYVPDLNRLAEALCGNELVFLGQPNNPTGVLLDREELLALARANPATVFVVDEAFADFVEDYSTLATAALENVVVLRSMTKFYAIPGLRLGFAIAPEKIAGKVRGQLAPWSVNTLAQEAGVAGLRDRAYADRTRATVKSLRERLQQRLEKISALRVYPGTANYLFLRLKERIGSASALARQLLQHGIAIRVCENYDNLDDRFFRVAVRRAEENDRLCDALEELLSDSGAIPSGRHDR